MQGLRDCDSSRCEIMRSARDRVRDDQRNPKPPPNPHSRLRTLADVDLVEAAQRAAASGSAQPGFSGFGVFRV